MAPAAAGEWGTHATEGAFRRGAVPRGCTRWVTVDSTWTYLYQQCRGTSCSIVVVPGRTALWQYSGSAAVSLVVHGVAFGRKMVGVGSVDKEIMDLS